jgi:DNA (cytosine-5)-methyltransferase 1
MKKTKTKSFLRVGTDCSGIEAPIQALKQLNISYSHEFSCEIDKFCKKSIEANYGDLKIETSKEPKIFFEDMTNREIKDIPDIDLYVCGFACQPFSMAGKLKGLEDPRGNLFWNCLDVIRNKKPKYFILENVKNLLSHNKGETWKIVKEELDSLKEYNVHHKILNTKDYGIPQNRERLFIVGINKKVKLDFAFPTPLAECQDLKDFVDYTNTERDTVRPDVVKSGMLEKIPKDAVFVDFSFKKHNYPNSNLYCPTITADSRLWCVPMHRYATPGERLKLQGFERFNCVVSKTQLNKQAGNTMSVNVLKAILKEILN